MNACDRVMERLREAVAGTLPPDLSEHVATCAECTRAIEKFRSLGEASKVFAALTAPADLVARIKSMPRFPAACDVVLDRFSDALEGTLTADEADAFLDHLQGCTRCREVWEAMATLREVGQATAMPGPLRAAAAMPPWQRVHLRRRRTFLPDLKLATAAAYLLASLAVFLLGNPASLAREGSAGVERVSRFARAAVENRIDSLADRLQRRAVTARDWVLETAQETWNEVEGWFSENPEPKNDVPDGDERRSS